MSLGIATNLLSTRLNELTDAGLIEKSTDAGRSAYQLTELGRHTDWLLWELTRFGAQLDPDPGGHCPIVSQDPWYQWVPSQRSPIATAAPTVASGRDVHGSCSPIVLTPPG